MTNIYRQKSCLQSVGGRGWLQGVDLISETTGRPLARHFGGVQYAQAPTGDLRFRRTRALPPDFSYGSEQTPYAYRSDCHVCPHPDWPGVLAPADKTRWSEDCLRANIWVPSGTPPSGGWPVFFFIHGGFLQFGNPNKAAGIVAQMFEETSLKAIVVMPGYRLNLLGFLTSHELHAEAQVDSESAGNMGFWDQRTALEWTASIVPFLGGNPDNITVGGYSAGAHSVFHQLSHDLYLPRSRSLIKRAVMWSNGTGIQPKNIHEHQIAFDELLSKLQISKSTSSSEKLKILRQTPATDLIDALEQMSNSQFRGFSDNDFVIQDLIASINTGDYGRRMKEREIKLLIGECQDEHNLYRAWKTPKNSWKAVYERLLEDYPAPTVDRTMKLYAPNKNLPNDCTDWTVLFGKIYADLQVHCLERGFIKNLSDAGIVVGRDILRYRIELRVKCADSMWPVEWGVTHATDDGIWWWGNGWADGLTPDEKRAIKPLYDAFAQFVAGETMEWAKTGPRYARRLTTQGTMDFWEDTRWEEAQHVWEAVNPPQTGSVKAKL
ncbi:hypothetical protein LTR84_007188 [Exophiala bonariae]|uniref:Carboxylesterase type B domain-containing protein n=1 Tax=Exophiala bonariae TaxID=1690606 RepID=A0AAV9N1Q7_9EURO|nr:hypothetical protein LTR84_007188 [Exophiala bonariae]